VIIFTAAANESMPDTEPSVLESLALAIVRCLRQALG
jgi:hypothetical protein